MKLEICIPTYDRKEELLRTIQALRPQLIESVGILILDNCSPDPVTHDSVDLADSPLRTRVRIVRNRVNIGGDANIARCFEYCDGEYMWLLGDDDPIRPDVVACILRHIQQQPDAIAVNFRLPGSSRKAPVSGTGLSEFIDAIDEFGSYMLISNNVYKMSSFRPHIRRAYQYGFACAPHVAILLDALRVLHGGFYLSAESLFGESARCGPASWSISSFALHRMAILTLPLTGSQRARLKAKMIDHVRVFNHAFAAALLEAADDDRHAAVYRLRKIYVDNFAEPFRADIFVRYVFFRLALLTPGASLRVIRLLGGRDALARVAANERRALARP